MVLDQFAKYLVDDAKCFSPAKKTKNILYNSATNYLSKMKNFFLEKFARTASPGDLTFMEGRCWSLIRAALSTAFFDRSVRMHADVKTGHEVAKTNDLLSISYVSFWSGDSHLAVYRWYCLTLYQLAGRCGEVSMLHFSDLQLQKYTENGKVFNNVQVRVRRPKTQADQKLQIFPFKNDFHQCWYFAMAYSLVMSDHVSMASGPLFVPFYEKAKMQLDNPDKYTASAARTFNSTFRDSISKVCQEYNTKFPHHPHVRATTSKLNPAITGHSPKKMAANTLVDNPNLATTWICDRAGWEMKNAHTLFDYLIPSQKNDRRVGRVLSNWTDKDFAGGVEPKFSESSIPDFDSSMKVFVNHLFSMYASCVQRDLLFYLVPYIFYYLKPFTKFVQQHPEGKWNSDSHPFLLRIQDALSVSGLSSCCEDIQEQVQTGFIQSNYDHLDLCTVVQASNNESEHSRMVDSKSLLEYIRTLGRITEGLREDNRQLKESLDQLKESHHRLSENLASILHAPQEIQSQSLQNQATSPTVETESTPGSYSRVILSQKNVRLPDLFFTYHVYNLPQQYENYSKKLTGPQRNAKSSVLLTAKFMNGLLEIPDVGISLPSSHLQHEDYEEWIAAYQQCSADIARAATEKLNEMITAFNSSIPPPTKKYKELKDFNPLLGKFFRLYKDVEAIHNTQSRKRARTTSKDN